MDLDKTIIALLFVIIIILAAGLLIVLNPGISKETSNLSIVTDTIAEGGTLSVKLAGENNSAISNENITISISNSKGKTIAQNVSKSDADGIAKMTLADIYPGTYNVSVRFNGNDNYLPVNVTKTITVDGGAIGSISQDPVSSTSYDSGAFYSPQAGRTIYTGEIHDGPDGHRWKHLGDNEWVMVD